MTMDMRSSRKDDGVAFSAYRVPGFFRPWNDQTSMKSAPEKTDSPSIREHTGDGAVGIVVNRRESDQEDTDSVGSSSSPAISVVDSPRSAFTRIENGPVYPQQFGYPPAHLIHAFAPRYRTDQLNLLHGLTAVPGRSMEEAIKYIHQQDVAAKQLKKLRPKKFRCVHCDVAFSNNGQLKGHIRIHTGERPFKCEVEGCNKAFTRNEELTRHRKIHTGLKPHSCEICNKSFGRKDHLKKHQRTHQNRGIPGNFPGTMFGFIEPHYQSLPSGIPIFSCHYPILT